MSTYYTKIAKHLKLNGCQPLAPKKGKGSHEKWETPDGKVLTVPRSSKAPQTFKGICKAAGIDEPSFLNKHAEPTKKHKQQQSPEP